MIKKFRFVFALFFVTNNFFTNNPIFDFCQKYNLKQPIVLITYNIKSCIHCELPLNIIVNKIQEIHSSIPICLLLNDSLTKEGIDYFCKKNELNPQKIQICFDNNLFQFLQRKLKNDYNIILLQPDGKILYSTPSHKNKSKFFNTLKKQNNAYILQKSPISHSFYRDITSVYFDNVEVHNAFVFFVPTSNLLVMYGKNGQFLKQLFLDSLLIDYFSLAQKLLSIREYQQLQYSFKNNPYLQKISLLRPKDIFNINQNNIGILFDIPVFKDSIYNKDSVTYETSKSFVVILDTNLQIKNILFFENADKTIVSPVGAVFSDSSLYLFNYSIKHKRYSIGKYLLQNNKLTFLKEIAEPENSLRYKYIPKLTENKGKYYLVYYTKSKTTVYELNTQTDKFKKILASNQTIGSNYIFHTEKNNYLLLTHHENKFTIQLYIPDLNNWKIAKEKFDKDNNNRQKHYYFVFSGYIWDVIVDE
ncbi:MAG: hypothetical protein KatS3mg027_1136 [Bacteroidia bacterium]|nr:MAG: hypothetical protein KatS3mg027_1136 [Bacteroidia bacterium]